jgi:hypothetical protein
MAFTVMDGWGVTKNVYDLPAPKPEKTCVVAVPGEIDPFAATV